MDDETLQKIQEELSAGFIPERAKGIDATIGVELTDGGSYSLLIRDQKLVISAGKPAATRITLRASSSDLAAIFQRKLDPASAFFQGRLIVEGDMSFALQLPGFFR